MFNYKRNKILLLVEPSLSSQDFIHAAIMRGYRAFIISANDVHLALATQNFLSTSAFFQVNTQDEEAVLNVVTQLAKKFDIEGVIPGYGPYSLLTAKIAAYLNKPGLSPKVASNLYEKDLFFNNLKKNDELDGEEYTIDGLIKNNTVHILSFTEEFLSSMPDCVELGYSVQSAIHPLHSNEIHTCLQDFASTHKLTCGFFHALVKLLKNEYIVLNFTMGVAKKFTPILIQHATGMNYYDKIFELFSNKIFSLQRIRSLNAGIIFFYEEHVKQKQFNKYGKMLSQNPFVVEIKHYDREKELTSPLSSEKEKIGYAILVHHDCDELKNQMKQILFSAGIA